MTQNTVLNSNRYLDFLQHIAGSSFSLWSNIFASNLMTQDFFKIMEIFSQTEATEQEGSANISKLERYFGRSLSKIIPLATTWRWTNKVFADTEAELVTALDHIKQSSPYALSKIINEQYLGGQYEKLNYGDALSPRRDPLGNVYPKTKGLLLGNAQDVFPTSSHWSANMLDSKGEKIVLSKEAREKLQTSNIEWERPIFNIQIETTKTLNLKEIEILEVKNPQGGKITFPEGTTAYEALLQLKGLFKINDKTLNETFRDELENPNSLYNTRYGRNRFIGGKVESDKYLLDTIRTFEREARDWLKYYGIIQIDGKTTTIEGVKSAFEKIDQKLYE
jgi:hypothetical protein